ncbi:MAG: DoxX family protein [Yoonia sp.]|uniref:DoxX family protein n=1 Tax=Yoonia sp. TaxID=2212373 RepID=UPI003EF65AF4
MTPLPTAHLSAPLDRAGDALLPMLARLVFVGVLFMYYWNSGLTKLGDGIFGILQPSPGAYVQIFPKAMEAVGYDTSQLTIFHWAVVTGGTIAEFALPVLIAIGLLTRLAAAGMIGFITLQSLTDLFGHGGIGQEGTLGAWFDRFPDALILDQRAFWVLCLLILVFKGAGVLSVDRGLFRNAP